MGFLGVCALGLNLLSNFFNATSASPLSSSSSSSSILTKS
jgi:hypothetical protein